MVDWVKIEVLKTWVNMGSLLPFFLKGGQNCYFCKLRGKIMRLSHSFFQRFDLLCNCFAILCFSTTSSSLSCSLLAPCILVLLLSLFSSITLIPFTMFILVKVLIQLPLYRFLPVLTTSHRVAP